MGKDRPRRARYRSLQSGAKTAGLLGVRDARGSHAVTLPDINPDNLALSHKGIRGGVAQEESTKEAQGQEGSQIAACRRSQKGGVEKACGQDQARRKGGRQDKEDCQENRKDGGKKSREEVGCEESCEEAFKEIGDDVEPPPPRAQEGNYPGRKASRRA